MYVYIYIYIYIYVVKIAWRFFKIPFFFPRGRKSYGFGMSWGSVNDDNFHFWVHNSYKELILVCSFPLHLHKIRWWGKMSVEREKIKADCVFFFFKGGKIALFWPALVKTESVCFIICFTFSSLLLLCGISVLKQSLAGHPGPWCCFSEDMGGVNQGNWKRDHCRWSKAVPYAKPWTSH